MFQHEVQLRVRYADTDQMGFVYYGNYAAFYEVARVEAFRNLGFSYKNLETNGIRYEYEIYNEEAQLLNTGETTLVFINMSKGRPVKMPADLKALISTYFNK